MTIQESINKQLENRNTWYVLGALLVFYLVRYDLNRFFANNEKTNAGTDPVARLALLLHDAFNPSGVNILIDFDGTRTSSVYEFAGQITNYTAVSNSYQLQFSENLTERLSKELTTDEFKRFFEIIAAKTGGTVPKPTNAVGKTAIAINTVPVLDFDASTKVSKTVKAGEIIGKVVGSQAFNTKVGYVEFWVVEWTTYFFFSSKGYVEKTKVYLQ